MSELVKLNYLNDRIIELESKLAEAVKAMERVRARSQESSDCANGTKPHNPDGDGDEMCEEGVCYATDWQDNIKDINETLSRLRTPEPKETEI